MNKTELISLVADKAGLSKKDADKAVNSAIDAIVETVANDEKVQIV
ncbi:MAG TPA: integration host factor subunit alpha, partial [Ruminococcaceae bacterium]|nr:integration host factor subunit alpha [Oscillospiraceae bacterium]